MIIMELFEAFQASEVAKIYGLNGVSDFKQTLFYKSF